MKAGDTVYDIRAGKIQEHVIIGPVKCKWFGTVYSWGARVGGGIYPYLIRLHPSQIGRRVFLTREEAAHELG